MRALKNLNLNHKLSAFGIDAGGFLFGYDGNKCYINADDTHTLTIGATRCGKTRCHVLPTINILGLAGESIICADPKGELHQYTYPFLGDRI